jgi:protein gp37
MEEGAYLQGIRERQLYPLIEATPWLDWLLLTKRPQNFRRLLPAAWLENPRLNVVGMTSVESADYLWRVTELLGTRFGRRGLSIEPLLGPVDLERWTETGLECGACKWVGAESLAIEAGPEDDPGFACPKCGELCMHTPLDELLGSGIHWVIVGGESGPGARPMHPEWVRRVRDQCVAAGVPFFLAGALLDGLEWREFPGA